MLAGKPLKNHMERKLSIVNESLVSLYLYTLMMMTDLNETQTSLDSFSWGLLGLIILSILVNLAKAIAAIVLKCRKLRRRILTSIAKKYVDPTTTYVDPPAPPATESKAA